MLIDVVNSREIKDRALFSQRVSDSLVHLNQRYAEGLVAPAVPSKGIDEFSALFSDASCMVRFCVDLQIDLYPQILRFSAAEGIVDILQGRAANEMDGPAFHVASQLMEDIERRGDQFAYQPSHWKNDIAYDVASRLIECCLRLIVDLPPSVARVVQKYWLGDFAGQGELAGALKVSQQAVSAALIRARVEWLRETVDVFSEWFLQQGLDKEV